MWLAECAALIARESYNAACYYNSALSYCITWMNKTLQEQIEAHNH